MNKIGKRIVPPSARVTVIRSMAIYSREQQMPLMGDPSLDRWPCGQGVPVDWLGRVTDSSTRAWFRGVSDALPEFLPCRSSRRSAPWEGCSHSPMRLSCDGRCGGPFRRVSMARVPLSGISRIRSHAVASWRSCSYPPRGISTMLDVLQGRGGGW